MSRGLIGMMWLFFVSPVGRKGSQSKKKRATLKTTAFVFKTRTTLIVRGVSNEENDA